MQTPLSPMPPRRSGSSNLFAVFAHLGCFFFPILVPLVIYLLTKDEPGEQFAAGNARESLNFQITLCIAGMVCGILIFAVIGLVLLPLLGLYGGVCIIIAAIKAANGQIWRYPLTLRLIK